ncbi:CaiB/BaiF CoA transferase family protein [Palleronia caenipelagi]|uniref:CoA transferase n=1 Tax=Palleronia caenipelagi TaxID=2489174 RepID=A0A547QAB0_9RHOB|nr:CaiB/BaiF CoA-transferase family protein [Palleronia caenipelagi]TRD23304.1 CoA transferase [Palleronia caenipelagi]
MTPTEPIGPLAGVTVLDLTRILAGPTCTQLLGDLGAKVIKVENPATGGDDTRKWGPPFVMDADGVPTDLSAYFVCVNRNKLSVAIDIASEEGAAQIRRLAAQADILVENFKPGGLAKYGLDAETLCAAYPGLVYCSISGFGQTGPNRDKPGYDLMAQGYGGIMSLTGDADGPPAKVGVAVADVVCGLYASTGILAALRHRDRTGQGQHVELALVDSQIAWMINQASNYLIGGEVPRRKGNAHPNIVPYNVYACSDGYAIIAVGNDRQFLRFADWLGQPGWADDPRFATNPARVENRAMLEAEIEPRLKCLTVAEVIEALEVRGITVGPVNDMAEVFATDQVAARGMRVEMESQTGPVPVVGNPLKFSATPVSYRNAPPRFGQDTDAVLRDLPEGE